MKILAIESSETTSSVAINEDENLIAQSILNSGLTHSENLLPSIEALMKSSGLTYDDINLFAVSVGPGSFTGIRIGVATVKGLAFGRNIPCVGVSSLEAMAYNFKNLNGIICPVMDARRNQLYNAIFKSVNGKIERLTEDRTIDANELAEELKNYSAPIYFCGGGYEIAKKASDGIVQTENTPELLRYETGYGVACVGLEEFKNGETVCDTALSPVYLRPSQAERMKNESNQ